MKWDEKGLGVLTGHYLDSWQFFLITWLSTSRRGKLGPVSHLEKDGK
jgi:hypothetical protein